VIVGGDHLGKKKTNLLGGKKEVNKRE